MKIKVGLFMNNLMRTQKKLTGGISILTIACVVLLTLFMGACSHKPTQELESGILGADLVEMDLFIDTRNNSIVSNSIYEVTDELSFSHIQSKPVMSIPYSELWSGFKQPKTVDEMAIATLVYFSFVLNETFKNTHGITKSDVDVAQTKREIVVLCNWLAGYRYNLTEADIIKICTGTKP